MDATAEKPEWVSLWNHGANAASDFGIAYSQWVNDIKISLAPAYGAVAGGIGLPIQAALYVASFFADAGQNTVEFCSFYRAGLLVSSRQPVRWVDNLLTLGDYKFQTQGNLIVSIQQDDQEPLVLADPASLPLPAALRGKVS